MRLIDADALVQRLANLESEYLYADGDDKYEFVYGTLTGVRQSIICTKSAPTVDIKTEVAREIFAEIEKITYRYLNCTIYSMGEMIYDLNELKNKYTKEGVEE